ncbi:MAG TPA: xanthine dehydrogenase family protein molybdopterin-binding subunit [Acetobacteraceae bacterium]|nr:xanthine dehydrogenase family protein molybdopterin-binding subunit [Acetobacteraceae bacterium]
MTARPFAERERIDAHDKVLGRTRFAADYHLPDMIYAMMVPATIAKGRVVELSTDAATKVAGVIRVLTASDFPPPPPFKGGGAPPPPPTIESSIRYLGQPVALVLGETLEAAIEGAEAITPRYDTQAFKPLINSEGATRVPGKSIAVGETEPALAKTAVLVDERYETPTQHHNPIELFATTAIWSDGHLTVYDCTQAATMGKYALAGALQIDPNKVDVKSAYVGGGFGQKGMPKRQTALAAHAAMLTGRPVKLVAPRGQIFHLAPYRPRSLHHIKLGADSEGRMVGLSYDVVQENTPGGIFAVGAYHEAIPRLYGIGDYSGTGSDIYVDRQAPGPMRGTQTFAACFAMESAVDELAYKLGRDPLELRLVNDTKTDPLTGHPMSARYLAQCLEEGARRFGWTRRTHEPGSMRLPDGTLVGWGLACGIFHASAGASEATLRVGADGTTRLVTGGHELGQGIRTAIADTILQGLDVDADKLEIVLGDTSAGPQPLTAGQWGTASVAPVTAKAVAKMQAAFKELVGGKQLGGNLHIQLARLKRPYIEVSASEMAPGQNPGALEIMRRGGLAVAGPEFPQATAMSYIAHFVELHIEPRTRRIRMPRLVSIADVGRVISPTTAKSQMYGGAVWGFSSALREETAIDPRFAGYLNDDLADYVVAVNADIGDIDVGLLDRPDPVVNSVGAKGMGELVMTGTAAAIANAVFHATAKRQRKLPIRLEDLL